MSYHSTMFCCHNSASAVDPGLTKDVRADLTGSSPSVIKGIYICKWLLWLKSHILCHNFRLVLRPRSFDQPGLEHPPSLLLVLVKMTMNIVCVNADVTWWSSCRSFVNWELPSRWFHPCSSFTLMRWKRCSSADMLRHAMMTSLWSLQQQIRHAERMLRRVVRQPATGTQVALHGVSYMCAIIWEDLPLISQLLNCRFDRNQ